MKNQNSNSNPNPNGDQGDQPPIDPSSDLSWQAFCYVANELDAKARRQFEIRLEQDQTARDAVVIAFEDTRLLDLSLSSTNAHAAEPTCELPNRTSQSGQRLNKQQPTRSKSLRPALLATAAAGLLAIAFTQFPWGPAVTEVALNMGNPNGNVELSEASMSLAETWADSDWQADMQAEIIDIEDNLTHEGLASSLPEEVDRDNWMTTTLIDMAESSQKSGS